MSNYHFDLCEFYHTILFFPTYITLILLILQLR
nr:MAG TPA: hypothetical protein [Caudoviricetes sp.]